MSDDTRNHRPRAWQLESELATVSKQLDAERVARHSLYNQLTVAENAARGERKNADKLRGELNLLRAENARLKRERDPDYDPRDGDPSLQKGEGAIPLGEHPLLNEAEHIEERLGMSPTLDQQLRDLGDDALDSSSVRESSLTAKAWTRGVPPYQLTATGAGVVLDQQEALGLCADMVAIRRTLRVAARHHVERYEDVPRRHWGPDDYRHARSLLYWLKAIVKRDFYSFGPVQALAAVLAHRVEEDGLTDDALRSALECEL